MHRTVPSTETHPAQSVDSTEVDKVSARDTVLTSGILPTSLMPTYAHNHCLRTSQHKFKLVSCALDEEKKTVGSDFITFLGNSYKWSYFWADVELVRKYGHQGDLGERKTLFLGYIWGWSWTAVLSPFAGDWGVSEECEVAAGNDWQQSVRFQTNDELVIQLGSQPDGCLNGPF